MLRRNLLVFDDHIQTLIDLTVIDLYIIYLNIASRQLKRRRTKSIDPCIIVRFQLSETLKGRKFIIYDVNGCHEFVSPIPDYN